MSAQTSPDSTIFSPQELVNQEQARRAQLAIAIANEVQADGGPAVAQQSGLSDAEWIQASMTAHAQHYADVLAVYPLTSAPVVFKDSDLPVLMAAQQRKQALAGTFIASATSPLGGSVSRAAVQALQDATAPISKLTQPSTTLPTQP